MNDTVTATLRALTSDTERLLTDKLRPIGITVPQMEFLTILAANPDHCGADIANAAHVSPQTGTTVLQNLTAKRLITVKHVPGNGHRNKVTITARGKDVLGHAVEMVADVEKQLTALLGAEAMISLARTVAAMQPHLPARGWQPKAAAGKPLPKRSNATTDKADRLHKRCADWAATVGDSDVVPGYVARQFGTQAHIDQLVADGRWRPDGDGYRFR